MTFSAFTEDTALPKIALGALLLTGALLRLWQYGSNSSLWLDEAALARNIIDRSPSELLNPLVYGQVAPIGFLLIQKTMISVAGASDIHCALFRSHAGSGPSFFSHLSVARR